MELIDYLYFPTKHHDILMVMCDETVKSCPHVVSPILQMLRVRISPAVANTVEAIPPQLREILRGKRSGLLLISLSVITLIFFAVYQCCKISYHLICSDQIKSHIIRHVLHPMEN